jgi:CRISPR-associated protein Cmr1
MHMKTLSYTVSFATPAFLGNAEQSGQWRTPPFKALLRQWWRVAVAKEHGYDHLAIREQEGRLFGHAWLENDRDQRGQSVAARKSRVRLQLRSWSAGRLDTDSWPGGPMDEVVTTRDGKGHVPADVYLGYGPVLPRSKKQGRSRTEVRGAIGIDQENVLRIAFPNDASIAAQVQDSLTLINGFGTLGSRARNGWGSIALDEDDGPERIRRIVEPGPVWSRISRPWRECLDTCDWAHAIGADDEGRALVWFAEGLSDWRKAMGRLANVRVAIRRAAKEFVEPGGIGGIHVLGYPAGGRWELRHADKDLRLATQLRFKVLPSRNGSVTAIAFHVPCGFPHSFAAKLERDQARWLADNQARVWQRVHAVLDETMGRI